MRDVLIKCYLDRFNNYLTDELFAEHNGLSIEQCAELLKLAHDVFLSDHPEG